jgi:hypothetical protein
MDYREMLPPSQDRIRRESGTGLVNPGQEKIIKGY